MTKAEFEKAVAEIPYEKGSERYNRHKDLLYWEYINSKRKEKI